MASRLRRGQWKLAIGILTMLFSHPGFHCVVAEVDDDIVGCVCQDERSTIAGFGPLSVARDRRRNFVNDLLLLFTDLKGYRNNTGHFLICTKSIGMESID